MSYAAGVAWSLVAAVAHSAIDVLRKLGSQRMQPADLVALVCVYDGVIATAAVCIIDRGLPDISKFPDKHLFFLVVTVTSTLAAAARLLYQRALTIAPLSLTVPYLAFTPAFVMMVSPLFLVGEVPSPLGMLGVFIVSVSGYLLGRVTAPTSQQQPSTPSKQKLPIMAPRTSFSGSAPKQQQLQHQHQITASPQPSQQQLPPGAAHHYPYQDGWREQQQPRSSDGAEEEEPGVNSSGDKSSSNSKGTQSSIWAMRYYNNKTVQAAIAGMPAAPLQLLAAAGMPQLGTPASDMANGSSEKWDSQAKELKGKPGRPAAIRVARLLQNPSRKGHVRQFCSKLLAAMSSPKAAPAIVLAAAFLYSVTASLDKVGIAAAQFSLTAYFMAQRVLVGAVGLLYLLCFSRAALRHVTRDFVLLLAISLVEQGSVIVYLLAIENILVSYVVAIKRVNVLLSTLVGCFLFKEQVGKRIPYILVMLSGMLLIVLQPGHEDLHHSHHTLRLL